MRTDDETISPSAAPAQRPSPRQAGSRMASILDFAGMVLVLAVLVGLFSQLSTNFFQPATFRTIANQIPALITLSVGMTLVLIIGGIDLSVGSVMALASSVLGILLVDRQQPLAVGVAAALAAGGACGLMSGLITVRWAIPSFIVTLGMLEAARGGAYLVTGSQTKYIGAAIEGISEPIAAVGVSPAFLAALGVAIAGQIILSRTVFGRYMVAIGTNEEAVRLSGINPLPTKVAVFVISGILAALAGVFNCSRLSSADPNAGIGWELSAIAAVVIGGTSLAGGRGSVGKSIFGVLIIAVLETGLSQTGVTEPVKRLVTGLVIVLAVILDALRARRTLRNS
ncbi:MAG: ABC transporter permease [Candidatus Sumerlaeaceae bacterium]